MKERQGCVYILTCLKNSKAYVGQTIHQPPTKRWSEHIKAAFVKRDRKPLYAAMRKYGLRNFSASVLWTGPESKLNAAEIRFVRKCRTFIDGGWGYNLTTGGGRFKLSKRSIKKIRTTLIKYYIEHPERCVVIGEQSTARMSDPAVRANLSEHAQEQFASYEARHSMSALKKRQFKKDPTIRERLSAAAKRQWASPVARAEKSLVSKRGWARKTADERKHTLKARRNMTAAQVKRFSDPVECKKISDGQLLRYQSTAAHQVSSEAQYKRFAAKPVSMETKAKMREKTKRAWQDPIMRPRMLEARRLAGLATRVKNASLKVADDTSLSNKNRRAR
jgi:group I intron endonuclease